MAVTRSLYDVLNGGKVISTAKVQHEVFLPRYLSQVPVPDYPLSTGDHN
jgi:hypothetical protein